MTGPQLVTAASDRIETPSTDGQALRCLKCGETWHTDLSRTWGRARETNGQGPTLRCPNLIEQQGAPKARTADPDVWETPREICGGMLMPVPVARDQNVRAVHI